MYKLGVFYSNGQCGLARDDEAAAGLYRLAADRGHAAAQNNLGALYEVGRGGLARDVRLAAELYRRAAAQLDESAQANLARVMAAPSPPPPPGRQSSAVGTPLRTTYTVSCGKPKSQVPDQMCKSRPNLCRASHIHSFP